MQNKIIVIPANEFYDSINSLKAEIQNLAASKKQEPTKEVKKELLTRKEAAGFLRISLPTLGEYVKRGILKAQRIGSRVLFDKTELENALHHIKTTL